MSKSKTFAIDAGVFTTIHATEVLASNVREENSFRTAEVNEHKIDAYAGLIASLADVKLTKGNLPKYARDRVWEGLTVTGGCKDAVAKKYLENSVGALREFNVPSQATAHAVKEIFASADIDSESKLAKAVKGEADQTPEMKVAKEFIGGFTTRKDENGNRVPGIFKLGKHTSEDDPFAAVERLRVALDEAERIARAAIEAAAEAEDERASYEAVMAALDAAE